MTKWFPAFIALCSLGLIGSARADSPQILALLETIVPVPLVCEGTTCRAELSAFCLQEAESAPRHGTPYVFAGSGSFDLVLSDAAGKQTRVPAKGELAIASVRGYSAVAVSLPRARLAAMGAETARIEVGRGVSLLPASLAARSGHTDDPAVKLATGPWRDVGRRVVETEGGATIAQVRALNAMINVLPMHDMSAPDYKQRVWTSAVTGRLATASAEGLAGARERLDSCNRRGRYIDITFMALCLQFRHDAMLETLTRDYWKAVGTGS